MFERSPSDVIEQIVLTGAITDPLDFDCYFSPPAVAERVVECSNLAAGAIVLEPSAGIGNIASAATRRGLRVDCFELLPADIAKLEALALPGTITQADFLTVTPTPIYDGVLMNPPFSKMADARHVMHAFDFLRPGGVLVAVMSASVQFCECALIRSVRERITATGGAIERLPEQSFKVAGTLVSTVTVTMYRR